MTSPLYASDRAVADGRRRSSTTLGRAPIPIKKIAFKVPQSKDAEVGGDDKAASKKSAEELEEFDEAIKREAREAGVQGRLILMVIAFLIFFYLIHTYPKLSTHAT
jgi:hypothetical protein